MKNLQFTFASLLIISIFFTSCEKDYDTPAPKTIPEGNVVTIADVRAMEIPGQTIEITEDISVYGVVLMDESTGNLYKESYISDATGNLYLRFISSSGLYTGDSIMVNLKGAKILRYNQMLQIDSLHPDNNIVKIATQVFKTPEITTIDALLNNMEAAQGKLVQIDNSWFQSGGQGLTFAYAATQESESRILQDLASSNTVDVRTSGYSNFANDTLPDGAGSFIGVVAQYNSGLQLLIRDPNELTMNGLVPVIISKNFDDASITSGGWTTQMVVGVDNWVIGTIGGTYAQISNYNGTNNVASESWLISPTIDFSTSTLPTMQFNNAWKYTGAPLQLMVSTNYDGISAPSGATWIDISSSVTWSAGNFVWASSGLIDLSAYLQPNVYIAFKYTGGATSGSTWEIDDINIQK